MMPVGPWSTIKAVAIRHEEGAVTARLGTALGPVTIPAGTGPIELQRPRGQRISIIQNGGFSLSISVSLYASKKTFKLLSLLSGWGRQANGLLLSVGMDGCLIQMDGMA